MKTFLNTARVVAVMFALVAALTVPSTAQASLLGGLDDLLSGPSIGTPDSDLINDSDSLLDFDFNTCGIESNLSEVAYGGDVTLSWEAEGFNDITINGQTVSGSTGDLTITDITESTIFRLEATDGSNLCIQTITIDCLPPPVLECKLEIEKSVNKHTALPGDELTYTITVKNTGTGNCTGGGVKIVDELHPYIEYLSHTVTSNFTAGYGTKSVYEAGTRTLYFNGNTIEPGEEGTITWTGKVLEAEQCGEYEVTNQAKVTSKEYNNFLTWVHSNTVKTDVTKDCPVTPVCESFTANPTAITVGGNALLTWDTTNATTVTINNGIGEVAADNTTGYSVSPVTTTTYTLSVFDAAGHLVDDHCKVTVTVSEDPVPVCKSFTATPGTLAYSGGTTTLAWEVEEAVSVSISPIVGSVGLIGSEDVFLDSNTNFTLTAIDADGDEVTCPANVTIEPPQEVFTCEDNVTFTTPNSSITEGESTSIAWTVTGADSVSVNPGSFTGATGNESVSPTTDTTYTLTASKDGFETINCPLQIEVESVQEVFTCENNVTFSVSDNSITRGNNVTLDWNVVDADSVVISSIGSVALVGQETTTPSDDITYTLTASKDGFEDINCPVSVNVSSGGGGGGSSSPRCELEISESLVKSGEEVTLTWDTSRATEVTLMDDRGKVLFTTDDMLSDDKEDYYDGSITVNPTRDTQYTLVAERGSRDRECEVEVEVEDLTVLQTRTQQPLVAGIALSNVPYTGFEAGPVLTLMFYLVLMAWALYVAYFLVLRQRQTTNKGEVLIAEPAFAPNHLQKAEETRPDLFPNPVAASTATAAAPTNLPTEANATVGYENYFAGNAVTETTADAVVTELENRAHAQRALLSSDAIEFFMKSTEGEVERNEAMDSVIAEAKKHYPLEDGWIVINQARMQSLCETCVVKPESTTVPSNLPEGTGSLAEAIVTGNVAAAYAMIGNRPMFALADAAADLDSVVRARQGKSEITSELLKTEAAKLSDEQIKNMVTALTGALDGTYSDEASAVKMAIMKAVKEVA